VVDGGKCLTFCPRYPHNLVQFSSVEDTLTNSQSEFWALDLGNSSGDERDLTSTEKDKGKEKDKDGHDRASWHESRFGIDVAEEDGTLRAVASTYSRDNHAIYDGVSRPGPRIITFAPMLKHNTFPLAEILDDLVRAGEGALGNPVEIEFAVRLPRQDAGVAEFGFLQIRPLTLSRDAEELTLDDVQPQQLICRSNKVLGNGRIENLYDAIVVDSQRFERLRSTEVATEVAGFNRMLNEDGRPYLLIGVGRWGSTEPWLGIPVEWDEISGARVIVEAGFRDFRVTPSQGSHFFQNLTAFHIGYFTVNPDAGDGTIDWRWLTEQPAVEEKGCVRHLHFTNPIRVVMNSRTSQGVILKPEAHDASNR
jgi:hypothetical protein